MVYTKNNPILQALLKGTKHNIYICSLANGSGAERHVVGRDLGRIERFLTREDQPGRGCYFCVSTVEGLARNKASARECVFLHVDIDLKDHPAQTANSVVKLLKAAKHPASLIINSGNGIHGYWLLDRPKTLQDAYRERLLRWLAGVFGGDLLPTHSAALMRLPGTHNTKHDAWKEVKILYQGAKVYRLEQLDQWLQQTAPVLVKASKVKVVPNSPFARYGDLAPAAPIDVHKRLANMKVGDEENGVHLTQLVCTASMLSRGQSLDSVIELVLKATRLAAKWADVRWDWHRERNKIEKMCRTWLVKKAEMEGREQR
jgi:hypothetical protein